MGLIKEAKPVADITLSLKDLFDLKGTPVAQAQHLDQLRKNDIPEGGVMKSDAPQAIDPLAYYVGKVDVNFSPDRNVSKITDLSPYLDRDKKSVKSITGELELDWGDGIVKVNAPGAQGACGFLQKAGEIKLSSLEIMSGNEYASVLAVALDGKPIHQSEKILLQVMTEDKNFGWKTSGDKTKTITDLGAPPLLVKDIKGSIAVRHENASGMEAIALDANGYMKEKTGSAKGNRIDINLEKDVLYYIIRKSRR
ncbi:MAG: hypothetical protein JXR97_13370, partial [Planctomycetes bacterium]|nr:hypothetical protein [Planctomycetota bacterium]